MVKKISQMKSKSTFSSIIGAVYIILSVLLLLCLAPMPYGYYQLVRFIAMTVFGVLAWLFYTTRNTPGLCAPEEQKEHIKDDSTTILSKVSILHCLWGACFTISTILKNNFRKNCMECC